MLPCWLAISVFLAYLAALFAVALFGERATARRFPATRRKAVYVLSSCIYCSSWSYFGSVGLASRNGLDFLPMYIGPLLAFAALHPLIVRMIRLSKAQNITSIADFIAARYGKSAAVGATIATIAALAYIPLIALQLKSITDCLTIFIDGTVPTRAGSEENIVILVAIVVLLSIFAIVIGTRRLSATEHQRGLMLALAVEAVLKLGAFLAVGIFVTWGANGGITDLLSRVTRDPAFFPAIHRAPDLSLWIVIILSTMVAALFTPRQFHVSVVENQNEADVQTAAWVVPLYLVAINLFVVPLAIAGLSAFPPGTLDRDLTLLVLPIDAGSTAMTLVALVGGFSAAIAVILIAAMVLSTMISNDLVMPVFLRWSRPREGTDTPPILAIRRLVIVAVMTASGFCVRAICDETLTAIGLLSLTCLSQLAPAAIGALIWSRGTARGAIGGSIVGVLVAGGLYVMSHTISPAQGGAPEAIDLVGRDLTAFRNGLVWSLSINTLIYVVLSLSRAPSIHEVLQSNIFVRARVMALASSFRMRNSRITIATLIGTVSRFVGLRSTEQAFATYHASRDLPFHPDDEASGPLIQYAELMIASTIGAASARMAVSSLLEKRDISQDTARQIVDDAALEIQNSRDLLQHAIDRAREGMAIFDADFRLVAWNRAYRDMFDYPPDLLRIGTPGDVLIRSNFERGIYGEGASDEVVESRLAIVTRPTEGMRMQWTPSGRVLDMRSVRLDDGGLFFTYTDATAQAKSEEELAAENETLERRVLERTDELQSLNLELARAMADAEEANLSKTRFLAAASHDLLQPLNAARLYTTSLRERMRASPTSFESLLAANVDSSLEAVEDILGALLELSHLDAGATRTEITAFPIDDIFRQLKLEFEPLAYERGLALTFVTSSLWVKSDRRLLRRLLQNLVSNAIKYTIEGRVLVGARRCGDEMIVGIHDTGLGIPETKRLLIFREFERLPEAMKIGTGVGLGLSIVERLARVLQHDLTLRSMPERGSLFSVTLPRAEALASQGSLPSNVAIRQRPLDDLTVAVIENEVHILAGMDILLRGWSCVVACGTGLPEIERALELRDLSPDVIIADYHIGDLDGLSIIASLRRRYGPLPAVLITADRDTRIRQLAQDEDVRILNKPLRPAALRALLSQWHLVKETVP
jgi:Na+/proline symporter/CheY-like chemotaxis protein